MNPPVRNELLALLQSEGPDFVRNAYRALLKRDADPAGFRHYLQQIQHGTPKLEVLEQICAGSEYKETGRAVQGLAAQLWRYRLRRRLFGAAPATAPPSPASAHDPAVAARLDGIEKVLRALTGEVIDEHVEALFASFDGQKYLENNADVAAAAMNPYEHWVLAGHRERRGWGLRRQVGAAAPQPMPEPMLAAPDGLWEWADHWPTRERLVQARSEQLRRFVPQPPVLGSVAEADAVTVARALRFPAATVRPRVSIIIPVYNHLALTLECLQSVALNTGDGIDYEVIVADDASSVETSEVLASIPGVRIQRNPINLGFLRNCNAAIPLAHGDFVLFLNNDVQVPAGWLTPLLAILDGDESVGIVGPAFVYPSGHLQEAGGMLRPDGTGVMVGLNDDPSLPAYSYPRKVDYVSGAGLMIRRELLLELGGFAEDFLPCYCEDSDLCLRAQRAGWSVMVEPRVHLVHHLSRTTGAIEADFKLRAATRNIATLSQRHADRLAEQLPRVLAFYLPQFHPFPENDLWWGKGFTEWTNVSKARPNFVGHYQPRQPADLGHYDLRLNQMMSEQAALARRWGIDGFCFYYYWFGGKRLLEVPIEQMLSLGKPDFPFCLCWANENWSRRWDGNDRDLLMSQSHSDDDDIAVIADLARYLRDSRYIRIDGRPLILVYRVTLFPDFAATAARWRAWCRAHGLGEIYIAMVESFELVHAGTHPARFGCDAAVEFPPQGLAHMTPPKTPLLNPDFTGHVADYRELAVAYATREMPAYPRFRGVMPGWDNTARRQNEGLAFEHATPGAFQAWLADALEQTMRHRHGDERLVFVNAWNEWAEGAYLEPDRRFGHAFLNAVRNARESALLRVNAPEI